MSGQLSNVNKSIEISLKAVAMFQYIVNCSEVKYYIKLFENNSRTV